MTDLTPPASLVDDVRRLTAFELSPTARVGYVGLLLTSTMMTVTVTALLVTEASLPQRTSIALGIVAAIGLGWAGFAAWVLSRKRPLFGRDRVIAGRMAVAFSGVFSLGALLVGYATSSRGAFAAAAMGVAMVAVAAGLLVRAKRQVVRLTRRRDELECQLRSQRACP
jgi:hypothetical protein